MNTKCLELRSICLFDYDTQEFVQIDYICGLDEELSETEIINHCGGTIKSVGLANDKDFMKLGMFPISIIYEREGSVKRAKQNSMDGFIKSDTDNGVYIPVNEGISLMCRMQHLNYLQRKKAA